MLKICAASICHSDVQIIRGIVYVQRTVALGYEIAGDLEEAGININSIKKGDRAVVRFLTPCHNRHLYLTGKSSSCKISILRRCTDFLPMAGMLNIYQDRF